MISPPNQTQLHYINFNRIIPFCIFSSRFEDWEDGLCERDVDGSFLHEDWNKDLQLFSAGEDGGQRLLQLFMLRAEPEFQRSSSIASNLQSLDSLKSSGCLLIWCRSHVA